ncbi:MAG: gamma-butyrobetaine hydroxylase-like domain-containing protein [Steroidobacteraceae bacterium]
MTAPATPVPLEIKLRTQSRLLELTFDDGRRFELSFEYLRVHSPSAEVRGHGHGQGMLVLGKENVGIRAIEPVGQYAVRLKFDDGHDTGLYGWKYLYELGSEHASKWAEYQARVRAFQAAPPAPPPSGPLARPPRPLRRHESDRSS